MKTGIHHRQKRQPKVNQLNQNDNNNEEDLGQLWWVCAYCGRACDKFEKLKSHIYHTHYENEEDRKKAIPKSCFIMPAARVANNSFETEALGLKQPKRSKNEKNKYTSTNDEKSTTKVKMETDKEDGIIKMEMPTLLPEPVKPRPGPRSRAQPKLNFKSKLTVVPAQGSKTRRISNRKVKPSSLSPLRPSSPIKSKANIKKTGNFGATTITSTATTTTTHSSTKSKSKPGKRLNATPSQRVTLVLKGKSPNKKESESSPSNQQDATLLQESFVCPTCSKSFARASYLNLHMRLHTGIRPYECRHACGKSFNYPANRIAHERLHTGEKPFVCTVCKASFANPSNFKKHKQLHSDGVSVRQNAKKGKKSVRKTK